MPGNGCKITSSIVISVESPYGTDRMGFHLESLEYEQTDYLSDAPQTLGKQQDKAEKKR